MDDSTRLTSSQSTKVFIQRDYSNGTAVRFQERFPIELEGRIDQNIFVHILEEINKIYDDAEQLSFKTFMENCCACLTGYLLLLCMPTHYEKCVKKAAHYINEQNEHVLNRQGILMLDPMEKGLRCVSNPKDKNARC
ncbi:unnamed protein product [Didymodactylos carnosus]|uniref:Ras modification protein ERF4 n=1 Tax=Didymodactylos carnosus TaxID=1234261 RepID=A0A814NA45_9BILA|nr:unnamed protein product [Didymodactylos carnosus]CAF1511093.1 unnamed protein product [Didymodactylos carnosus]CAF3853242.1 unnamed protein product [Didymodactylos carnosus]CAF4298994.1 unnamed protein product [Didymodactylos carnosus]